MEKNNVQNIDSNGKELNSPNNQPTDTILENENLNIDNLHFIDPSRIIIEFACCSKFWCIFSVLPHTEIALVGD